MSRRKAEINLSGYEDIFNDQPATDEMKIMKLPLKSLVTFKNHPFRVIEDDQMAELIESVKARGILVPGLARPSVNGTFEIIAGHRRRFASEAAQLSEIPMMVRNLTDDEATIIMVDSNIQREDLLPSEKAFAYRMKMDALKHQGKKGAKTAKEVGEKAGDSERTVQRYIRLTYLIPELLEAVDCKSIAPVTGSELSFLKQDEQTILFEEIVQSKRYPNGVIAASLKEYSSKGELTMAVIQLLLKRDSKDRQQLVIKAEHIREYFPPTYKQQQIETVIFSLLEEWKARNALE